MKSTEVKSAGGEAERMSLNISGYYKYLLALDPGVIFAAVEVIEQEQKIPE